MKLPKDSSKITELKKCHLWKDESGTIIYGSAKQGSSQDLNDAKEIMDKLLELADGKKVGFVFDLTGIVSQNKDARNYYSSPIFEGKFAGIAIITKSIVARVIANFYMGLNQPSNPTRVFNDEKSADSWIKSVL